MDQLFNNEKRRGKTVDTCSSKECEEFIYVSWMWFKGFRIFRLSSDSITS